MRSAVRLSAFSASVAKTPQFERSAGICVAASQPPLAKVKKSSPGLTLRSMPARSRPWSVVAAATDIRARRKSSLRMRALSENDRLRALANRNTSGYALIVDSAAAVRPDGQVAADVGYMNRAGAVRGDVHVAADVAHPDLAGGVGDVDGDPRRQGDGDVEPRRGGDERLRLVR